MTRRPYSPSALQRLGEQLHKERTTASPEARLEREAFLLRQVPRVKGVGRIAISFTPTPLSILSGGFHKAARFPGLPAFTFATEAELEGRGIAPNQLIQAYQDSANYGHPLQAQARFDVQGRRTEAPGIIALRFEDEGASRQMYAERDMTRATLDLPPAEESIRMPTSFITALDPRTDNRILRSLADVPVEVNIGPVRGVDAFLPTFE